jgi:hypothetical protein
VASSQFWLNQEISVFTFSLQQLEDSETNASQASSSDLNNSGSIFI